MKFQWMALAYRAVKGKATLSLCLTKKHAMKAVLGEWKYSSTHSLTSALDGGEWSASRPGRFTSRERVLGTRWIGGWVGPRSVLDAVVKRKIPSPRRESNPRTPIVQPVAQRYTEQYCMQWITWFWYGTPKISRQECRKAPCYPPSCTVCTLMIRPKP
jgi:hypothetical protein